MAKGKPVEESMVTQLADLLERAVTAQNCAEKIREEVNQVRSHLNNAECEAANAWNAYFKRHDELLKEMRKSV